MKPIAIFYHGLLFRDTEDHLLVNAVNIIREQVNSLFACGPLHSAAEFHVGLNGGRETLDVARLIFPVKAQIQLHGLQCKNENRTILMLEEWLKTHPGWYVLYFHSKGASHENPHDFSNIWRRCMMRHAVTNWRDCVDDLNDGYDAVGSHWMEPPATPAGHHIFAGNFWWATSDFLRTLPSIMVRDRIKESGIDSIDSRYEAEVWLGNGPTKPKVKDYHPNWNPSRIESCKI
jgi:hypothetical protein